MLPLGKKFGDSATHLKTGQVQAVAFLIGKMVMINEFYILQVLISGLWMPIGILSSTPKHLDLAQKLLRRAMGGRRYGRKARFSQKDASVSPTSFEEGLPFLNYCGLADGSHYEEETGES